MKFNNKAYKIIMIPIFFVLTLVISSTYVSSIDAKTKVPEKEQVSEKKATPMFVNWNDAMSEEKPIAVDFYTPWCGYCKRFEPILNKLSSEYSDKYNFVKINGDEPQNEELLKAFNIRSYPSFYLYDPKSNKCQFVNQSIYTNPDLVKKELDNFYKYIETVNNAPVE